MGLVNRRHFFKALKKVAKNLANSTSFSILILGGAFFSNARTSFAAPTNHTQNCSRLIRNLTFVDQQDLRLRHLFSSRRDSRLCGPVCVNNAVKILKKYLGIRLRSDDVSEIARITELLSRLQGSRVSEVGTQNSSMTEAIEWLMREQGFHVRTEDYTFKKYLQLSPGSMPFHRMSVGRLLRFSQQGLLILCFRNVHEPERGHWVLLTKVDEKNSLIKIIDPADAARSPLDIEVWEQAVPNANEARQNLQASFFRSFYPPIPSPSVVYAPPVAFYPHFVSAYNPYAYLRYFGWGGAKGRSKPSKRSLVDDESDSLKSGQSVLLTGAPYHNWFISQVLVIKP